MKVLISAFIILFASVSYANPFDQFIGSYSVTGEVSITKDNAKDCVRFGFPDLVDVTVERDSGGYNNTHIVTFHAVKPGQDLKFSHPIMEYRDKLEGGSISYAETSGDKKVAENEWGSIIANAETTNRALIVGFVNLNGITRIFMQDFVKKNGVVTMACYYSAELVAK